LELAPGAFGDNPMEGALAFLKPSFGFKDGWMVAALSPSHVRQAFQRVGREDDPSGDIRSNKEFASLLPRLGQEPISSLSGPDWKQQFEGFYRGATSALLLFVASQDEIPIDLTLLPEVETL